MEIVKRVLAVIAIVISVVFIIACLGGIYFSWSINTSLTNTFTGILTGVERVLTVADGGLERVNTRLAEAQSNVDTIEENVETAGDTLSETSIVYEIIDRTVGEELFPKIETARESLGAIAGSLVAFNETLEAANEIPFVEVPTLTTELETASERMATIQSDVEETRAELRSIREEAISKPVTAITMRTTRISDGLETAQMNLTGSQNNIDEKLERVGNIKSRVPGVFDLISIIFTLVFLWIGLGQAGLIVLSWRYLSDGSSEAEEKEATTYDVEEDVVASEVEEKEAVVAATAGAVIASGDEEE